MNNVAALQNQLAFDVQQRMKSIESLLEGNSDAPSKPDPEVEYWRAQIRKLSEGGPPTTSQSNNRKFSADKPDKIARYIISAGGLLIKKKTCAISRIADSFFDD